MSTLNTKSLIVSKRLNIPIYNDVQRDLLSAAIGTVIYNSDAQAFQVFGGTDWIGPGGGLYDFTTATFTPGGQVGRLGPSLQQARTGLSGPETNVWKNDTAFFNNSNGIQLWTVPKDGTYRIEVWGAQGGNGNQQNYWGGFGARMRGDFTLTEGSVLKILVGQTGGQSYGGGGGMTAVATTANSPLIVAGGGNTTSPWSSFIVNAVTSTSGTPGQNYNNGGTNGNGGGTGPYGTSDGGAGFYGNGSGNGYNQNQAPVPQSFVNGGNGNISGCGNSIGGFGGGSASDGCYYGQSGPGGGYSGGGAGSTSGNYGGAGGSFNSGTNQSNSDGSVGGATQTGNGKATITFLA